MLNRLSNWLFIRLKCQPCPFTGEYYYDGPTHMFAIEKKQTNYYYVEVFDGSQVIAGYNTRDLWSLPTCHLKHRKVTK